MVIKADEFRLRKFVDAILAVFIEIGLSGTSDSRLLQFGVFFVRSARIIDFARHLCLADFLFFYFRSGPEARPNLP